MLKTAFVNCLSIVERRVVMTQAIDLCEVKTRHACFSEDVEVSLVRQQFVDLVRERMGHWIRRGMRKLPDEPAVFISGFKHDYGAAVAACFEVEHHSEILGPRMFIYKSARTE